MESANPIRVANARVLMALHPILRAPGFFAILAVIAKDPL
jgi:hypothetical protein